jgi:hypothetical protein
MDHRTRSRYRPQIDVLEDRALPSTLGGLGAALAQWTGLERAGSMASALSSPLHSANLTRVHVGHAATTVAAPAPNFFVIPHQFTALYSQYSAKWWQYALSVPADQSPFLDQTGANFAAGQSGVVWFLSGTICFNPLGQPCTATNPATVVRNVTLPAGKFLFFPVLNAEADNVNPGMPDTTFTADQLRGFAKSQQDAAENMVVQVDGRAIPDVPSFRVTSPVFGYTLPPNNILTTLTGVNVPARTVFPAVSDGVYLMLAPLSPGHHTIHFAGDTGPQNFALDVTYNINVLPRR